MPQAIVLVGNKWTADALREVGHSTRGATNKPHTHKSEQTHAQTRNVRVWPSPQLPYVHFVLLGKAGHMLEWALQQHFRRTLGSIEHHAWILMSCVQLQQLLPAQEIDIKMNNERALERTLCTLAKGMYPQRLSTEVDIGDYTVAVTLHFRSGVTTYFSERTGKERRAVEKSSAAHQALALLSAVWGLLYSCCFEVSSMLLGSLEHVVDAQGQLDIVLSMVPWRERSFCCLRNTQKAFVQVGNETDAELLSAVKCHMEQLTPNMLIRMLIRGGHGC